MQPNSNQMSEIDLLGSAQKRKNSKMLEHRPPNISVSKVFSENRKWRECKVTGKNISIRSYSACCSFEGRVYIYGGYQMLSGSLSDFYSIRLGDDEPHYGWEEVHAEGDHPGPRSKHALLATQSRIYLVSGLSHNARASNQIFEFEPAAARWRLLKPQGVVLPPLQSSACVLAANRILVACGYHEQEGRMSNAVYQYEIEKNQLSELHANVVGSRADCPAPRVGCALATDSHSLFLFGGKDEATRYNDLWSFDLTTHKYTRIETQSQAPVVRNGHSMNYDNGRLVVFGGIHDVTWELDDLYIYDIKAAKWTTLEQDSPRKLEKKSPNATLEPEGVKKGSASKRKNFYDTVANSIRKPLSPKRFGATYHQEDAIAKEAGRNDSPSNSLQEQRRKAFNQKKADMLKNFEVPTSEKAKFLSLETSSQAMRNSLDVIGNPDPSSKPTEGKLTEFGKESFSKFLGPLENNSNIVIGKKPCARDGHCATMVGKELIIFGGDRHQMSFNDIYKLDVGLAEKAVLE